MTQKLHCTYQTDPSIEQRCDMSATRVIIFDAQETRFSNPWQTVERVLLPRCDTHIGVTLDTLGRGHAVFRVAAEMPPVDVVLGAVMESLDDSLRRATEE